MKRKSKRIWEPIYRKEVIFMVGGTPAELRGFFELELGEAPDFDDRIAGLQHKGICKKTGDIRFYVWLKSRDNPNLSHEARHITDDVMREIELPICEQTEEAFAYLQEFYFREMEGFLKGQKGNLLLRYC